MDTDDDIEKNESGENIKDMEIRDPEFQILSPSGYIPESTFLVSGVGARPGIAVMILDAALPRAWARVTMSIVTVAGRWTPLCETSQT